MSFTRIYTITYLLTIGHNSKSESLLLVDFELFCTMIRLLNQAYAFARSAYKMFHTSYGTLSFTFSLCIAV